MHLPLALVAMLGGCATPPPVQTAVPPTPAPPPIPQPSPEIQRRADAERLRALEFEIERLRADLRAAELTLLAVESGVLAAQGRAEAVSALAEARIQVERAARRAPWRSDVTEEAQQKLNEAGRQLAAGRIGSAVFFVSRAARMAESLEAEADLVASNTNTQFVRALRVNLRVAPREDAAVVDVLPSQLPVFVEGREGAWALVRTATGRVGFVRSDLLRRR